MQMKRYRPFVNIIASTCTLLNNVVDIDNVEVEGDADVEVEVEVEGKML